MTTPAEQAHPDFPDKRVLVSKKPASRGKAKPRKKGKAGTTKSTGGSSKVTSERFFEPVLCIVDIAKDSPERVFGLSTADRLKRQFAQAGITEAIDVATAAARNGPVIFVRSDIVIDQPLVPVLAKRPNLLLVSDENNDNRLAVTLLGLQANDAAALLANEEPDPAQLKLLVRSPSGLEVAFWKGLRKRETPYADMVTAQNKPAIEWRMFMGTYKGATDFVTKHVWPRPAFLITRRLAETAVTPNMVTAVSAVCVGLAFWLFFNGHFLTGLVAAWMMTFLDTVDGKLARTTLTSSKWGDIFDHGIDLIHPPFWYAAWAYGLMLGANSWSQQTLWWLLGIIVAGYLVQRLMEGIAIKWLGLEIHIWRPIDTLFRQVTARRNPNLALLSLFSIIALPDWGFAAVAFWTALCLGLHGIQLVQAYSAKKARGELESWMNASAPVK